MKNCKKLKSGNITVSLIGLAVIPMFLLCMIVLIATSRILYDSVKDEVEYSLGVLAYSSYENFELRYPGDYVEVDGEVRKGSWPIKEQSEIFDKEKSMAGADITLFYGDTRVLTTIRNNDGTRALETHSAVEVTEHVKNRGETYFSDRVLVNGISYFGYYMPVKNSDGNVVGMMFAGKPRSAVVKTINRRVLLLSSIVLFVMGITATSAVLYSRKIIFSINKTEEFLEKIANGDLRTKIDPYLLERKDEIGDMGRFAVMLQKSITDLVGKDPLTGLHNRRSCDVVLQSVIAERKKNGTPFTLVLSDIDYFKRVNDTYGHQAGDEVLKNVASVLIGHMEQKGFVFRWGGEEFLLLYEGVGREEAVGYLKMLQKELAACETCVQDQKVCVTMTFGMADDGESLDMERLVEIADERQYEGKRQGRNRIVTG